MYFARCADAWDNSIPSFLMYDVKADDFHLPSVWISESFSPMRAAVVAAPMR